MSDMALKRRLRFDEIQFFRTLKRMLNHESRTVEEMHEQWFPHAPFEAVREFWESLQVIAAGDAGLADWERHGRAYLELQRYSVPTIDLDQL